MLYSSDFNGLLARWDAETKDSHREQSYKDAVRDCIYDLRCMIDDKFAEEMLAQEAWEQQMEKDSKIWSNYLENKFVQDGILAV